MSYIIYNKKLLIMLYSKMIRLWMTRKFLKFFFFVLHVLLPRLFLIFFPNPFSELMISYGPDHYIRRDELRSLGYVDDFRWIHPKVIDCWAMLLNKNEMSRSEKPKKFWFGSSHSANILKLKCILLNFNFFHIQLLTGVSDLLFTGSYFESF